MVVGDREEKAWVLTDYRKPLQQTIADVEAYAGGSDNLPPKADGGNIELKALGSPKRRPSIDVSAAGSIG